MLNNILFLKVVLMILHGHRSSSFLHLEEIHQRARHGAQESAARSVRARARARGGACACACGAARRAARRARCVRCIKARVLFDSIIIMLKIYATTPRYDDATTRQYAAVYPANMMMMTFRRHARARRARHVATPSRHTPHHGAPAAMPARAMLAPHYHYVFTIRYVAHATAANHYYTGDAIVV